MRTSTIENYPATSPKVEGSTLALNLYEQVQALNVPLIFSEVISIKNDNDKKIVKTLNQELICKNIIIATGRNYKKLGVENEEKFTSHGISYCATCDGALYKNKNVAIIGAGDSAFKEALYLSNLCNEVTIIARRSEFKASSNYIDRAKNKENIRILSNYKVKEFIGKDKLELIKIQNNETRAEDEINIEGCFIYIGQTPELPFFENLNIKTDNGYIITNEKMETNIKNIYACGDIRKKEIYQLVTATYDGCIAAEEIIEQKEKEA